VAILCILAVVLSFFANEVLKIIFERPRPFVVHYGINLLADMGSTVFSPTDYSFPSGHTVVIFAVCTIFGKKYGHLYIFMALACLVGFSRIYLGVHYPLDVIFGALFGISVSLLILRYENEIFNGFEELINKIKSFNSKT
ncbi:MAG: phosphatase PAP2 family protein, partial [Methanobacterium sp.]|nr:phosphatase PAP2 family protein [Methanobacterium sp.]